jgi:hypothetical protein
LGADARDYATPVRLRRGRRRAYKRHLLRAFLIAGISLYRREARINCCIVGIDASK